MYERWAIGDVQIICTGVTRCELMIEIVNAYEGDNLQQARNLIEVYASSLGINLDFQDFATELASLPGDYSPPSGRLLIARWEGQIAGCVALRKLDDGICEMKRLYVRSQYRGLEIGRALAEAITEEARGIGYVRIRLDTLPSMIHAKALYSSLGFREIAPYRYNPMEGATFMELALE